MNRIAQLFAFSFAVSATLGAGVEEIVTVSARPGATQSYLLPETVAAIRTWILGQPFPKMVD